MKQIGILLAAMVLAAASVVTHALAQDGVALANAVVAAADRSPEDRVLDPGRKPADLLAFLDVQPGWAVADLGAGGGYTTELLRRAVGDHGRVYGQNSKFLLEKFLEKPWSSRLAKPAMQGVVRVDRDFDAPLPVDIPKLDAVVMVLFYHDTVWLNVDRSKMNAAVFASLKPGGVFLIVDHSARAGDATNVADTFHRIEEDVVKKEVQAAGFKLDGEADFLRNADDTRDWNDSPRAAG